MKPLLLIFLIFQLPQLIIAQKLDWQHSSQWRLYKIDGSNGLRLRRDSLVNYKFINMNVDTTHDFFQEVIALPKEKNFVWMGAFYASCQLNGELHKINIGTHAGYFFDEQIGQYFQIAPDKVDDWLEWISSLKKRILK